MNRERQEAGMIILYRGRGILTFFTFIFVIAAEDWLMRKMGRSSRCDYASLFAWSVAFVNWVIGRYLNRNALEARRGLLSRLFYNAPHQFLGLPMELWSIPLFAFGFFCFLG
ncbi:hypothetical protein FBY50_1376 [Zymomonas mobilis]|uniref:hypothetical protein n=1 Tax=Zymomonas mobilis TaxID=542 RepID=UPI000B3A8132|nr:hypothetical protein [Zymomonas mobilis]ART93808.1 hypothetical protein B9T50_06610 [Zymomonas mobilis subsp. mobilis]MCP9308281.1 hypothetical protein [Zymomonas mobilis]TWD60538.1 hypothetical protein FBY50_1376 [Zymomonas mobilis]